MEALELLHFEIVNGSLIVGFGKVRRLLQQPIETRHRLLTVAQAH